MWSQKLPVDSICFLISLIRQEETPDDTTIHEEETHDDTTIHEEETHDDTTIHEEETHDDTTVEVSSSVELGVTS